jgi:two-component system response regulator FlrC
MRDFLTKDPAMMNILKLAENVAASRSTILLIGESGVGKEELSHYIHKVSGRSKGPFVAVNCAALPGNLLESELFGFEKGAFTGAHQTKPGKIELAEGGTFLLDEISEMPLELQGKLLRVIQEKELERLGSSQVRKVDVRFICTTNRDLKDMVKEGTFRKDLFYRINVVPVRIPALRERPVDVEYIARCFVDKINANSGASSKQLDAGAVDKLKRWSWPGNVRELWNVLERSMLLAAGQIVMADDLLIEGFAETRAAFFGPGMTVEEAERLLITKTLEYTNQNRTQAAKLLGISIRTLRNKLNEYSKKDGEYESNI